MEDAASKFNINVMRDVYLFGEEHHASFIRKLIRGYHFLNPREGKDFGSYRQDAHFVIAVADFTSPQKMQDLAKLFAQMESPLTHRIVYVVAPSILSREQLLFAQEVGARYVCVGPGRNDQLKEYLKRMCVDAHQNGPLEPFAEELAAAYRGNDRAGILKVIEKLKALPSESEESLRLLAVASQYVNDLKRAEAYLKRILMINSQNLWAANTLGKIYLRNGRAAQGIEILSKMSQFHELNSERLLELGDAQILVGKSQEAQASFEKGDKLTGGADERFKEGMAKVKLADNDLQGALACIGGKSFSEDVISFLNMRAILSIREGRVDEGIGYYGYALQGAGEDKLLRAKLNFNMGLGYARSGNLDKAKECFEQSCVLGGARFPRAKGPLDTVVTVIKNRGKSKKGDNEAIKLMDEMEWETLY